MNARIAQIFRDGVPFDYRPDVYGDLEAINQVFNDRALDFSTMAQAECVRERLRVIRDGGRRPLIIDAGAHIGASAVWFARLFPDAHVVAVEPEPGNIEVLRRNVRDNILVLQGGVSEHGDPMGIVDPNRGSWAYRLGPGVSVKTYRIIDLLARAPSDAIPFIVKIDIEGGEKTLFNFDDPALWLKHVALVIIELHDWMLPGQAVSRGFMRALSGRDYDVVTKGEHWFCFNNAIYG